MINQKFGEIKGLSQERRLPLLGKIRLGVKVQKAKTSRCQHGDKESCFYCSYPKETNYFVCPEEVQTVYGKEPLELDIMLPVEHRFIVFPQSYKRYGLTRGLKCIGNGEVAHEWSEDKKEMVERSCPCEKCEDCDDFDAEYARNHGGSLPRKDCKRTAYLMAVLPKVSMGGVYQIMTHSRNSIIDINSGLDYTQYLIRRISWVPLKLARTELITHHDGKSQTHYTIKLFPPADQAFIMQLRSETDKILLEKGQDAYRLPAPKDEGPAADPVDFVEAVHDQENDSAAPGSPEPQPAAATAPAGASSKPQEPAKPAPAAPTPPAAGNGPQAGSVAEKSKAVLIADINVLLEEAELKGKMWKNRSVEEALASTFTKGAKSFADMPEKQLVRLKQELADTGCELGAIVMDF